MNQLESFIHIFLFFLFSKFQSEPVIVFRLKDKVFDRDLMFVNHMNNFNLDIFSETSKIYLFRGHNFSHFPVKGICNLPDCLLIFFFIVIYILLFGFSLNKVLFLESNECYQSKDSWPSESETA